jgi:hypothetical protein
MAPKKASSKSAASTAAEATKTMTTAAAVRKASMPSSSAKQQKQEKQEKPTTSQPTSSALDHTLVRKAVAALFTYEAKKQEGAAPKLIDDYSKPVIAQIQLIKGKQVLMADLFVLNSDPKFRSCSCCKTCNKTSSYSYPALYVCTRRSGS